MLVIANDEILYHHGILGMKWGVRRSQAQLNTLSRNKKVIGAKKSSNSTTQKKTSKTMTDEELKQKISRLELEKRYKELSKSINPPKSTRGKDFVMRVLEKSGENIGTQLATNIMGTMINKAMGSDVVNPKKGQKDK